MNTVQKIESWGDAHHAKWLDVIRILLGLLLLGKGIAFVSDIASMQDLLTSHNPLHFSAVTIIFIIHIVAFVHVVFGGLLMLGLLTRAAAVMQIPGVLGAIVFVNISRGFSALNAELWLSILVLMLLILFWIVGSGPFSVDEQMKRTPHKRV